MGFVHLHPMLLEAVVEIRFRRVVTLSNEPLRRAVDQQDLDFGLKSIQLAFAQTFLAGPR
jgi:hypothetical protein